MAIAYKIRYGSDRRDQDSPKQVLLNQIVLTGLLAILVGLVWLCEGSAQLLKQVFLPQPDTVAEQAVVSFAQVLAQGKGWYQGLVVWCRTLIDVGTD